MRTLLADMKSTGCGFQVAYDLVRSKCGFEDTSDLPWIPIQRAFGSAKIWAGLSMTCDLCRPGIAFKLPSLVEEIVSPISKIVCVW